MRIGQGFDVHQLVPGSGLPLGGIYIDCDYAVVAHSDGDVLLHAVMDALLGALALGDIGSHFPDTDPAYAGCDSTDLLREVMDLVAERGYRVGNIDACVVAQVPKVGPHRARIQARVAGLLNTNVSAVSIKATTTEGLGFTGRKEGIAAQVVVLLEPV